MAIGSPHEEVVSHINTTMCGRLNFLRVALEILECGMVIRGF